jgi:hypothetical protein
MGGIVRQLANRIVFCVNTADSIKVDQTGVMVLAIR